MAEVTGELPRLVAALRRLRPEDLPDDALQLLEEASSAVTALRSRWLAVAMRRGDHTRHGATSPTAWIRSSTGMSGRAASEATKLARAVERTPALGDALADGRIGAEAAAVVARADDRGVLPDTEALVRLAESEPSPERLGSAVRRREAAVDQAAMRRDEHLAHRRRSLHHRRLADGSVEGSFRLPQLGGEALLTALEAATTFDSADVPDEHRRTPAQRRADALVSLADAAMRAGELPTGGGRLPQVTLVVPVEALSPEADRDPTVAASVTEGGAVISHALARRVLCDAAVRRLVVDSAGLPLEVGRATRQWSVAQRQALLALHGGCVLPGCDRPGSWTEIHHVTWWRNGGRTDIDNGAPLCRPHHTLVHQPGWALTLDPMTHEVTITTPDGTILTGVPSGPTVDVAQRHTLVELPVDAVEAPFPQQPTGLPAPTSPQDPPTSARPPVPSAEPAAGGARPGGDRPPTPDGRPVRRRRGADPPDRVPPVEQALLDLTPDG